MTWHIWVLLGLGGGLVLYLIARFLYIWFFCGGNQKSNYYSD